jgi:hypothetical protein
LKRTGNGKLKFEFIPAVVRELLSLLRFVNPEICYETATGASLSIKSTKSPNLHPGSAEKVHA